MMYLLIIFKCSFDTVGQSNRLKLVRFWIIGIGCGLRICSDIIEMPGSIVVGDVMSSIVARTLELRRCMISGEIVAIGNSACGLCDTNKSINLIIAE